jgi:hypothetical protein
MMGKTCSAMETTPLVHPKSLKPSTVNTQQWTRQVHDGDKVRNNCESQQQSAR